MEASPPALLHPQWILHDSLLARHSSSNNYFHSRLISKIIEPSSTVTEITYHDIEMWAHEEEFMKRYYKREEISHKFEVFKEFYSYHQDDPAIYGNENIADICECWHERKRDLLYRKLKVMCNETMSKSSDFSNTLGPNHTRNLSRILENISEYNPFSKKYYLREQQKNTKDKQVEESAVIFKNLKSELSQMLRKMSGEISMITNMNSTLSNMSFIEKPILEPKEQSQWKNPPVNINININIKAPLAQSTKKYSTGLPTQQFEDKVFEEGSKRAFLKSMGNGDILQNEKIKSILMVSETARMGKNFSLKMQRPSIKIENSDNLRGSGSGDGSVEKESEPRKLRKNKHSFKEQRIVLPSSQKHVKEKSHQKSEEKQEQIERVQSQKKFQRIERIEKPEKYEKFVQSEKTKTLAHPPRVSSTSKINHFRNNREEQNFGNNQPQSNGLAFRSRQLSLKKLSPKRTEQMEIHMGFKNSDFIREENKNLLEREDRLVKKAIPALTRYQSEHLSPKKNSSPHGNITKNLHGNFGTQSSTNTKLSKNFSWKVQKNVPLATERIEKMDILKEERNNINTVKIHFNVPQRKTRNN